MFKNFVLFDLLMIPYLKLAIQIPHANAKSNSTNAKTKKNTLMVI